jgi:acyl-CoA synthetase (NDP forming)
MTATVPSGPAFLRAVVNPRSVAVIGASADPLKFGGRVIHYVIRHGFPGRILPINASAAEVLGLPAYPSVGVAPGPIDVAILAVPTQAILPALEECGRAGVHCAVVITSDYAEAGGEGRARQDELVATAHRHGMRIIGPNCLGFINPHAKLAFTSSVALAVEPMPMGSIGVISQSGSLMASMISNGRDVGVGVSIGVSLGNQADLEICDFIEYMVEDPQTKAIAVYAEGFRDGARFVAAARSCRAAGKPLVVAKSGTTDTGGRVTQSHTASLAGSHAVLEAVCREEAICLVDDPERAVMVADLLARWGAPRGDALALMCPSGGTLAVGADRVAGAGFRLPTLSAQTRERFAKFFPANRPLETLDFGGLPAHESLAISTAALDWMREDPDVGLVLLAVASSPQVNDKIRKWGEIAIAGDKPVVLLLTPGSLVDGGREALRAIGCPFVNRMDDAVAVARAAIDYGIAMRARRDEPRLPAGFADPVAAAAALPAGTLTEVEAKGLLRAAGIRCTRETPAATVEAAIAAADTIGYPVVLKLASREVTHKSDAGGVKLRLADAAAVHSAWHEIAAGLQAWQPGAAFTGCLVQEMAGGELEAIVGCRFDPQFGPVVVVGLGGVYVELLQDVQLATAPVSRARAREMLTRLRGWPLLVGMRGRPALDIDALAETIERTSWLAAKLGARLVELDANPVLVRHAGEGVVAVDARATLAPLPH